MSTRIAINGLGRIGCAILKLVIDEPALDVAAVNEEPPSAFSQARALCWRARSRSLGKGKCLIAAHGGKVTASVSEKIFAVIAGAKPGAKLKKARDGYGAAIVG
jgi:glyceraldehyde-3-phosphate dehydrogenase/erythrose-4-phosphate dehydrogenase